MKNTTTEKEPTEQSNIQSHADTNDKVNYPLLTREPLNLTPFWIVGSEQIGYKLTWGKYTFNDDPFKTQKEVEQWYIMNKWTIILHLIAIGIQASKDEKP